MSECLAKLGSLKVLKINGNKDGRDYSFYSVERSYKDKNEEWKSQSINLKPSEMVVMAELLSMAASKEINKEIDAWNNKSPDVQNEDVPF